MQPGEEIGAEGMWGCLFKSGTPSFLLCDNVTGETFSCLVPDALLSKAMTFCHRRVEVVGTLRENGVLEVSTLHDFPQPRQIPSVADMRSLLESPA